MEAATQRDALWCSTQFVSQPFKGDTVTWEVERLAVGKRAAQLLVRATANGQTAFVAIGSTGIAADDGLTGQYVAMPVVQGPEDSPPRMSTINLGAGARWFASRHFAFCFDLRFYETKPEVPTGSYPGRERMRVRVLSAGIAIR